VPGLPADTNNIIAISYTYSSSSSSSKQVVVALLVIVVLVLALHVVVLNSCTVVSKVYIYTVHTQKNLRSTQSPTLGEIRNEQ